MKLKEIEEMKQVNEETLNKWRNMGFLLGLTEGSINEWRCAKSFDDMANYCLNQDSLGISGYFETVTFPIIRRSLCTGKNRLNRIIKPEEIVSALSSTTVKEAFDILDKTIPIKGKNSAKSISRRLIRNFCERICKTTFDYEKSSCFDYITKEYDKLTEKIKIFQELTDCDFEAEMTIVLSEVVKEKLN